MVDTEFVFVCGCPRSGTTALAIWLNQSPEICIGIERFSSLFLKAAPEVTPALFNPERFTHIRPGDTFYTELTPGMQAAGLPQSIKTARLIGDKIPTLFRRYDLLVERFPLAKVVFIVRDPILVAASYKRRHLDPNDNWKKNALDAVAEWNEALHATEQYREMLDIQVVDYHRTIENGDIAPLCAFLGVDAEPLRAYGRNVVRRGEQLREQRVLNITPDEEAFIRANAHYDALSRLMPVAAPGAPQPAGTL